MTRQWLIDTVERAGTTFAFSFVSLVLLAGDANLFKLSTLYAAAAGGSAAALSVLKAALAAALPATQSPASLAPILGADNRATARALRAANRPRKGPSPVKATVLDVTERTVLAFAYAFVAALVASGVGLFNLTVLHDAVLAGIAASLALVKAALATAVPGGLSPASLVSSRPAATTTARGRHAAVDPRHDNGTRATVEPDEEPEDTPPPPPPVIPGPHLIGDPVPAPVAQVTERPQAPAVLVEEQTATLIRRIPEYPSDRGGGRLGRHVEHDPRSRAFAVEAISPHKLQSVTHRRLVKPFDQGQVGSCPGEAITGALSTQPFKHHYTQSRAIKLYEAATKLDDIPGYYLPGDPDSEDTGSSTLGALKAALSEGLIGSYKHCFDTLAMLTALQDGPVIIGVNWYDSFDQPGKDGYIDIPRGAQVRGGHEVEVLAYSMRGTTPSSFDMLTFANSWGTSWGAAGFASFTVSTMDRLLGEQGDCGVPIPRS